MADPCIGVILLPCAIGDFRLVGFWKRIRDSRFARLDTAVYSPLCLVLAIGSAVVGFSVQKIRTRYGAQAGRSM